MDFRVRVRSDTESARVQTAAFSIGVSWGYDRTINTIQQQDRPYLYMTGQRLTFGNSTDTFDIHASQEVTPDYFISYCTEVLRVRVSIASRTDSANSTATNTELQQLQELLTDVHARIQSLEQELT